MSTLAVELFEKTLQVLEMHRGGWMNAASALQTGLRRAAVALGECFISFCLDIQGKPVQSGLLLFPARSMRHLETRT